jgi:hypothetical protein
MSDGFSVGAGLAGDDWYFGGHSFQRCEPEALLSAWGDTDIHGAQIVPGVRKMAKERNALSESRSGHSLPKVLHVGALPGNGVTNNDCLPTWALIKGRDESVDEQVGTLCGTQGTKASKIVCLGIEPKLHP